ncbi:MAG: tyrosine-protein kinase family protein [Geminicoccaceae bacterium]
MPSIPGDGGGSLDDCLVAQGVIQRAASGDDRRFAVKQDAMLAPKSGRLASIIGAQFGTRMSEVSLGQFGITENCRDEDVTLDDCIVYDPDTDLHLLLVKDRAKDPSKIMTSARFATATRLFRGEFDLIVMDVAPVLAVTETRLLMQHTDHFVFCIRWEATNIETVDEALQGIETTQADMPVTAVLARVDMKKAASYGLSSSKHHKAFKKYYQYREDN